MTARRVKSSGQELVEFALIAPILFALLFGIMEFGILIWRYNTVANAAREGARYCIVQPDAGCPKTTAEWQALGAGLPGALSLVFALGGNPTNVQVNTVYDGSAGTVQVTASYDHQPITFVLANPILLRAASTMQLEVSSGSSN